MKPLRCLSVPSRGDYHRSTYRTNMRRSRRCCSSEERPNRRAWTPEEDKILSEYIEIHGYGDWANLPQKTGLKRHGRSCRLRWLNYLSPDIKRGNITPDEEELLIRMHRLLGNRWSLIAGRLPGRTDNEIKNYWNTHLSKKLAMNAESERRMQILKRRSTSPSPFQNDMFKPRPVKITTAARDSEIQLRPNGCNGDCSNHIPAEATVKLSNVQETTNSTQSGSCDLLAENLIANHESERIVFGMAHVGTEVTNSTCSMSSLKEWQSPHSDNFADTLDQCLMDLDDLSFPDFNLLSSPLDCLLTDFGLEEFYKGPVFIDCRDQSA